jgi:hypothetical protein
MENQKIQSLPSKFDLNELRLPANYGATFGVKKVLNSVSVGKPNKAQFFRIHASLEMTFLAMILEQKETRETYLVRPDVADQIAELVRAVQLLVGVDRQGNAFLVPVTLPGLDGRRNKWHESLAQACELAKAKWIRIAANMGVGAYDVFEAQSELMPPEWPEYGLDQMIEVAFRGKIVESLDHPVVRSLLGRV